MKNLASAKEEKEKENKTVFNHGESKPKLRSLWFIFFTGLSLLIDVFFLNGPCSALPPLFNQQIQTLPAKRLVFNQGDIHKTTMGNGLVVLIKEKHDLPLIDFFLCVRSGSAQEAEFAASGIAHFTEHMVFKGTGKRASGDIFKEIESLGGEINANTSYDYTGFRITVPAKSEYPALEILSDMVSNASFNAEELEKERKVILKEIKLNEDDPQRNVSRLLWESAYKSHPYRSPILGQEELFKDLTREDLLYFYAKNYTCDNMVLAVVGDITKQEVLDYIKELFTNTRKKDAAVCIPEPQQYQIRQQEKQFTSGLTYLLLGFHSVSLTHPDCYALDTLAVILGEGKNSRLYRDICDQKRQVYSISALNYTPREPGLFIVSAYLKEKNRQAVLNSITRQIERIKRKGISLAELESAKNKIISQILLQYQIQQTQAQDLALNQALASDYSFTEKYISKIQEVNGEDIIKVARQYLNQSNLTVAALIPEKNKETTEPNNSPSGKLTIGIENLNTSSKTINKYILDNGLTLLIEKDQSLPLISLIAVFKGGLRLEQKQTNGLCNLVAQMLDKGTKTKNAQEIANTLESQGAELSSFSGNNSFGLSLNAMSKDLEQMLPLLADLITNSSFPQIEIDKQKEKNLATLLALKDDIFETGINTLKTTLYQQHPYGLLSIGDESSIKQLKRADLANFHRNFCVANNMVLAIFGDVDEQAIVSLVNKSFSNLNSGQAASIQTPLEPADKGVQIISKPVSKQQTVMLMGFPGATVFSHDRYCLDLICLILSQSSGRLFTNIRDSQGFAYTLGAYSTIGLDPGYITIYVATTNENIENIKKELSHQLTLLKQQPLTTQELTQAKQTLLAKKMIGRQTLSSCATESSLDELYGLGYDNYLGYSQRIDKISAEDITRCANQYFDLNNYALIVVGPAEPQTGN